MTPGAAMYATNNAGTVPVTKNPLTWQVKTLNSNIGSVLVIQLPVMYGAGSQLSIQVLYNTQTGGNAGVNFLNANQTQGKVYPMLYTYALNINGRMVAPQ